MPYITQAEFSIAFGEVELEDLSGGEASVFDRAEMSAAATIDGYIGARYGLPLAFVPELVKRWALDITRYALWEERSPDEVRRRYDEALEQLLLLAKGMITLPPSVTGAPATQSVQVAAYSAARVFTAATLAGY